LVTLQIGFELSNEYACTNQGIPISTAVYRARALFNAFQCMYCAVFLRVASAFAVKHQWALPFFFKVVLLLLLYSFLKRSWCRYLVAITYWVTIKYLVAITFMLDRTFGPRKMCQEKNCGPIHLAIHCRLK